MCVGMFSWVGIHILQPFYSCRLAMWVQTTHTNFQEKSRAVVAEVGIDENHLHARLFQRLFQSILIDSQHTSHYDLSPTPSIPGRCPDLELNSSFRPARAETAIAKYQDELSQKLREH